MEKKEVISLRRLEHINLLTALWIRRQTPYSKTCLHFFTCFMLNVAGLFLPSSYLSADAFRIPEQGAAALGQANAFAAQADDPSALQYNPAGMAQLEGVQYSVGTNLIGGHFSHTSQTGNKAKGDFDGIIAIPPPSNFYLVSNLKDYGFNTPGNLTIGLGMTSPFGTLTRYPKDAPFATIATFSALPLIDIKPTVGFKVNKYLSVGGGLDVYTFASYLGEGQAELQAVSGTALEPLGIPVGSSIEVNGTDTSVGFNLGLLWTPLRNIDGKPRLNVAFVYRSQTTLQLEGNFLVNGAHFANAKTDLELPRIFTWGIALWPVRDQNREWKVEVDLDYADWRSFKNLDVRLSNGITLPQERNWNDTFAVNVGTEYKWISPSVLPNWEVALRTGYVHSATPVPERTFEPGVPDADYNGISIGIGFLCTGHGKFLGLLQCRSQGKGLFSRTGVSLDLAYQTLLYRKRVISNNVDPVVTGKWDTTIHIGGLNLRINF